MGQFVLDLFIGFATCVVGEHGLEMGIGHAGKTDEVLAGKDEDTLVAEECFEVAQSGIVETMARYGKPDEVAWSTVADVAVEMVALLAFMRFTPTSCTDEPMRWIVLVGDVHMRIFLTADFIVANQIAVAESIHQLLSIGVHNESVFVSEIRLASDHRRRDAPFSGHSSRGFGGLRSRRRLDR